MSGVEGGTRGRARTPARSPPRTAARTLARGWSTDARRWTWATTGVLASTLVVLLATAGLLDGTTDRTLDQVSDFYTGELRITPSRPGAVPQDWFRLDGTPGSPGAADLLRGAGVTVAERVEAQFILSRRGFADAYNNEQTGVPVTIPGSDPDPTKALAFGALVGIAEGDAGLAKLQGHVTAGRMPRPLGTGVVEVLMSESRARAFLTDQEGQVPARLLEVVGAFGFDITSAQLDPDAPTRDVLRRQAKVVGLYGTGIGMLDSFTLVAPAQEVRELLGRGRDEPVANVLLVQSGAAAAARVASQQGWASQDTDAFADDFVGQMVDVLQAVAWLVASLLFLVPAGLIAHGIARQLASQQRELAVATAIGVPSRTLGWALAIQVLGMAAWACAIAAAITLLLLLLLPLVLPEVPAPLPLAFAVTWRSTMLAVAVTLVAVAAGLWVGMRSRMRLPLASALRAA